jgi:two-component system cell cycle sensor histidine kinase/response regulator CckA
MTTGRHGSDMKILVLEDDPYTQKILQSLLAQKGHAVHFTPASKTSLLSVKQLAPDLILLDIPFSDSDGLQLFIELRANPEIGSLPVVVLIHKSLSSLKEKYRALGVTACLDKPFRPWQLMALIDSLHL